MRKVEEKPYTRRGRAVPPRRCSRRRAAPGLVADDDEPRPAPVRERPSRTARRLGHAVRRCARAARAHAAHEHGGRPWRRRCATSGRSRTRREAPRRSGTAGDVFRTPAQLTRELRRDELALYDLIFKRTIASQMKDAGGQTVSIELGATTEEGTDATFRASGTVITFPGFMLAYASGRDEPAEEDEERRLPALTVGQELTASALEPQGHETSPPARYTEASLVKALEERGIGRPSTYASIMGTILDRGYVYKKGTALVPMSSPSQSPSSSNGTSTSSSTTYRATRGRPRPHRGRRRAARDVARAVLLRRRRPEVLRARHRAPRGDRRARGELDRDPGLGHRRPGRAVRPVPRAGDERASVPERPRAGRGDPRARGGVSATPAGQSGRSAHIQGRSPKLVARVGRYGPYVTETPPEGSEEAAHGVAVLVDEPRDRHPRGGRRAALTAARARRRRRAGDPRLQRPLRPVRESGARRPAPSSRSSSSSRSPFRRPRLLAQPKQRHGRGAAKPPLRSSAPTQARASRSSSRTVASAPTSRTGKRTRACGAVTTWTGSRSSAPSSCSPNGARRGLRSRADRAARGGRRAKSHHPVTIRGLTDASAGRRIVAEVRLTALACIGIEAGIRQAMHALQVCDTFCGHDPVEETTYRA